MKFSLFIYLSSVLFLSSCATTEITNNKNLPPLPKDSQVTVFTENAPTFGYEVICDAEVNADAIYGTSLSSYTLQAESIARKCGADTAMVESLSGYGNKLTVKIKAIKRNSEEAKILDGELIKKMVTAASLDNTSNLKTILAQINVSKNAKDRAPSDTEVLELVMLKVSEKGTSCPTKSMEFLAKDYNIRLGHIGDYKYASGTGMYRTESTDFISTSGVLSCASKTISDSYDNLRDKNASIRQINNVVTESLNMADTGRGALTTYIHFNNMYPKIMKDVEDSCQKDSTSELCSFKPNLQKISAEISGSKKPKKKKGITL